MLPSSSGGIVTASKGGISAMELKRQMGFGSYQTAWSWLHKIRKARVRPEPSPLAAIHLVFGLAKRWLLGTHHGAVSASHRFARVIEHAVQIRPTTYRALVTTPA